MMWYSWSSLASFESWHEIAKAFLGIPHSGRNALTGEIDEGAQWTTAYTAPVVLADDDVRAVVEDHVASAIPDGIGVPCASPPAPPEEWTAS